jgi:simple sugar transport system permease protein
MAVVSPGSEAQRLRRVSPLRLLLTRPEFGSIVGAVLIFLVFWALTGFTVGKGFMSWAGFSAYIEIAAQVGILGATVSLLMIAGEFDLSVGSMVGAAGLILAMTITTYGLPLWLGVVITFAFALGIGALNGYIVVRTGLPSFIVTLGSLYMLRGAGLALTRVLTNGLTIVSGVNDAAAGNPIAGLFNAKLFTIGGSGPNNAGGGDFKIELLWWIVVVAVATWVLLRTRFGNWIFAVGGSKDAARSMGVPVTRVKIMLFMATAGCAALYACIQVLSVGTADVLRGQNKEFEAIITAVIGGTLLTGGYGSALGSAFGAFILGVTQLGIFFVPGFNSDWYAFVLGALLLVAAMVNNFILRRASGARS